MAFTVPHLNGVQLAILALIVHEQTTAMQSDPNKGWTHVHSILSRMHTLYGLHPMNELDRLMEQGVIEVPPLGESIPGIPQNSCRITRPVLDQWKVSVAPQINRARQNGDMPKKLVYEPLPSIGADVPMVLTQPPPPIITVDDVTVDDSIAASTANSLAKAMGVEPPHPDMERLGVEPPALEIEAPKRGRGRPRKVVPEGGDE